MKKRTILFTALATISIFAFVACQRNTSSGVGTVEGYAPIYADANTVYAINSKQVQGYVSPGKIVQAGTTTYQIDNGTGIHVIDASNIANPQKIKFLSIPGISEMSIENNILLCNNFNDLVSIDISNLDDIKVLSRVEKVFTNNMFAPPAQNVYFECVDESKGNIIGWKKTSLNNPRCKTNF